MSSHNTESVHEKSDDGQRIEDSRNELGLLNQYALDEGFQARAESRWAQCFGHLRSDISRGDCSGFFVVVSGELAIDALEYYFCHDGRGDRPRVDKLYHFGTRGAIVILRRPGRQSLGGRERIQEVYQGIVNFLGTRDGLTGAWFGIRDW